MPLIHKWRAEMEKGLKHPFITYPLQDPIQAPLDRYLSEARKQVFLAFKARVNAGEIKFHLGDFRVPALAEEKDMLEASKFGSHRYEVVVPEKSHVEKDAKVVDRHGALIVSAGPVSNNDAGFEGGVTREAVINKHWIEIQAAGITPGVVAEVVVRIEPFCWR